VGDPEILKPAFAMVALTFAVWVRMYYVRLRQIRRERIAPQSVATSAQAAALLTDSRGSDNLRNLFELPVLFYAALLVALVTGLVTPVTLWLAWTFVVLRVLHSFVHCTYNRVLHRFALYVAGAMVLWILWAYLAWHQSW
jgi:hypothetical protein